MAQRMLGDGKKYRYISDLSIDFIGEIIDYWGIIFSEEGEAA